MILRARSAPPRRAEARVAATLAALSAVATLATSCRHDEPPMSPDPCPPGQFQPQGCPVGPVSPGVPGATGPSYAPGAAPAIGLPCTGDLDVQCPLAHCSSGRCGGCTSAADCKNGAACGWTPFGMACVPALPGLPGAPPSQPGPGPAAGGLEGARQACVDRTNQMRARVGARPLARNPAKESCSDEAARSDSQTGVIHGAFGRCGEWAQNECPSWRGPADAMVGPCLEMMFAEGPGPGPSHGHYENMTNSRYVGVTCGFWTGVDGKVWMVQNFY